MLTLEVGYVNSCKLMVGKPLENALPIFRITDPGEYNISEDLNVNLDIRSSKVTVQVNLHITNGWIHIGISDGHLRDIKVLGLYIKDVDSTMEFLGPCRNINYCGVQLPDIPEGKILVSDRNGNYKIKEVEVIQVN